MENISHTGPMVGMTGRQNPVHNPEGNFSLALAKVYFQLE